MVRINESPRTSASSMPASATNDEQRAKGDLKVAQSYVEANNPDLARKYVDIYLQNLKSKDQTLTHPGHWADALKISGDTWMLQETLQNAARDPWIQQELLQNAAYEYERSLQHRDNRHVSRTVCDIYCKINVGPEVAAKWAAKANELGFRKDVIDSLKTKATCTGDDGVLTRLKAQLEEFPADPQLRVTLIRLLMSRRHFSEAYGLICEAEEQSLHKDNLVYHKNLIEILQEYKEAAGRLHRQQLLLALDHVADLYIKQLSLADSQQQDVNVAVNAVLMMDKELEDSRKEEDTKVLVEEVEAQILFHIGNLIFCKAVKGMVNWAVASEMANIAFIASHNLSFFTKTESWYTKASTDDKKTFEKWHAISCLRRCQTGHILARQFETDVRRTTWKTKIVSRCQTKGCEDICSLVFGQNVKCNNVGQNVKCNIIRSPVFQNKELCIPEKSQMLESDKALQKSHPKDLQIAVWIALHHYSTREKTQPDYKFSLCNRLMEEPMSTSLFRLHVLAFFYAVVRKAAKLLDAGREFEPPAKPDLLPLVICKPLCDSADVELWTGFHQFPLEESCAKMLLSYVQRQQLDIALHVARTFHDQIGDSEAMTSYTQKLWNDVIDLLLNTDHSHYRAILSEANSSLSRLAGKDEQKNSAVGGARPKVRKLLTNNRLFETAMKGIVKTSSTPHLAVPDEEEDTMDDRDWKIVNQADPLERVLVATKFLRSLVLIEEIEQEVRMVQTDVLDTFPLLRTLLQLRKLKNMGAHPSEYGIKAVSALKPTIELDLRTSTGQRIDRDIMEFVLAKLQLVVDQALPLMK